MAHNRNKKLYNYLVNTFDISKEKIIDHVNARVDDILKKHIRDTMDSIYVRELILDHLTDLVNNGLKYALWGRQSFQTYFKKVVREEIKKILDEKYQIEIKEK